MINWAITTTSCDKCGAKMIGSTNYAKIEVYATKGYDMYQANNLIDCDLCEECYKQFKAVWDQFKTDFEIDVERNNKSIIQRAYEKIWDLFHKKDNDK